MKKPKVEGTLEKLNVLSAEGARFKNNRISQAKG